METHQLKLIDSTYSVSDAKEVICSLLNDKIRSLNDKISSSRESIGSDTTHFENRVRQLKADKELLIQMLVDLHEDDSLVDINCAINLTVNKHNTVA